MCKLTLLAVATVLATCASGVARGELTKEASDMLVELAVLQQTVENARHHDVRYSAEMPTVAELRVLIGATRTELVERLGKGRVCAPQQGRECLVWFFYWKPFSENYLGSSPVLGAVFDENQRCIDVLLSTR